MVFFGGGGLPFRGTSKSFLFWGGVGTIFMGFKRYCTQTQFFRARNLASIHSILHQLGSVAGRTLNACDQLHREKVLENPKKH